MSRRRRNQRDERGPAGFIAVDKPSGWTSHDVVDAARGWFGGRQIGHLGTLDPLATGVLPLAVRAATKLERFVVDRGKAYAGKVRLGIDTDTLDAEGKELARFAGTLPDEQAVRAALEGFVGDVEQLPPMFSAVKKDGVPLHKLARQGREVERPTKQVRIHRLELVHYEPPCLDLEVDCSEGTYVRVLASDLGKRLGCGAYLAALRRTKSGPFELDQALTPDALAAEADAGTLVDRLVSPLDVLGLPPMALGERDVLTLRQGGEIACERMDQPPGTRFSAHDAAGVLVAVVELHPGRRVRPIRVLATR